MTARELFKKANLAKMVNTKTIKYGKITEDIAYEIVETNSYEDEERLEKRHIVSFVKKKDDKYVYNADECVMGTLTEILTYIAECKRAKKLINKK